MFAACRAWYGDRGHTSHTLVRFPVGLTATPFTRTFAFGTAFPSRSVTRPFTGTSSAASFSDTGLSPAGRVSQSAADPAFTATSCRISGRPGGSASRVTMNVPSAAVFANSCTVGRSVGHLPGFTLLMLAPSTGLPSGPTTVPRTVIAFASGGSAFGFSSFFTSAFGGSAGAGMAAAPTPRANSPMTARAVIFTRETTAFMVNP